MTEDVGGPATPASFSTLRCFVIGPIGNCLAEVGSDARVTYEEALEVFTEVVVPACKEGGRPQRAGPGRRDREVRRDH